MATNKRKRQFTFKWPFYAHLSPEKLKQRTEVSLSRKHWEVYEEHSKGS